MIPKKIIFLALFFFVNMSTAETWEDRRAALDESVSFNEFRIFYSLDGKDALSHDRQRDDNENGVPDFIESVRARLIAANDFFVTDVGLVPPLESKRYKGKARFIDVNVLDFSNNKNGPKNGVAYDGIQRFNRQLAGQHSTHVITVDLSASVKLKSQSIEHELFHLYQNGYTFFKNRWYTEGTARWSELIVNNRLGATSNLPMTTADKLDLFEQSYDAKGFWNMMILITDERSLGKRFVKRLLEELDIADNQVALDRSLNIANWKEAEQKSSKNNSYIWDAVLRTALIINYEAYSNKVNHLEEL